MVIPIPAKRASGSLSFVLISVYQRLISVPVLQQVPKCSGHQVTLQIPNRFTWQGRPV